MASTGLGSIERDLTMETHPCGLGLTVPSGTVQAAEGEEQSVTLPSKPMDHINVHIAR